MSSAYEEDEYDCSDEGDDYEIDPEKLKLIGIASISPLNGGKR